MNPKIDAFLRQETRWPDEMKKLRAIILSFPLIEELKWGKPCYTFKESNVLIIQGFKEYCALMFCKGALLKDPAGVLKKPGENTQGARQVRFTHASEIAKTKAVLKAYIREAIDAEKSGLKVEFKRGPEPVPAELQNKFKESAALKTAFYALTPGRQRAYILYFSAPKQSKTKDSRIEKYTPQILRGKGFNDR